ncbi:uncharacterized protein isoform X3 [Choristoneura fumiferana]|uniref:uncharacterized protein isoform X3 n=1 Tax=Choristoneura fumiferana TaxID=7141 RepID=UPI003D154CBF
MVVGMLALMVHIWVCSMRFFQYYLDTLIKDSPNVLLEMTTAGLLGGGQTDLVALGPLTRFLKQQQPQIHITLCWFLSLCYADYVRKHYCTRFNMPYLEQWQAELHERAGAHVRSTMARVHSFVGGVQRRLRGFATPATTEAHTVAPQPTSNLLRRSAAQSAACPGPTAAGEGAGQHYPPRKRCVCDSSANPVKRQPMLSRNSELILKRRDVPALGVILKRVCVASGTSPLKKVTSEEQLWWYLANFERTR